MSASCRSYQLVEPARQPVHGGGHPLDGLIGAGGHERGDRPADLLDLGPLPPTSLWPCRRLHPLSRTGRPARPTRWSPRRGRQLLRRLQGRHAGVGAAPVVDAHHPAVGGGEGVAAGAEQDAHAALQPQEEAAGLARRRGPAWPSGCRAPRRPPASARRPRRARSRLRTRSRPSPSSATTTRSWQASAGFGVGGVLAAGVAGLQPRVVRRRRHQQARRDVARLDPLGPRHPLLGQQRALGRQQHDLVERHHLRPGRPGHASPTSASRGRRGAGRRRSGSATRSPSAWWPRYSPTPMTPAASTAASRARSTAARQSASGLEVRGWEHGSILAADGGVAARRPGEDGRG